MRFVVARSIDETHDELRRQWWGAPGSLHIDCWAEIAHADGYDVRLQSEPYEGSERLFYVNLGGYEEGDFSERHRNMFVVSDTAARAKARALESVRGWDAPHKDDLYQADQAFALDTALADRRLHIHLTRSAEMRPLRFSCEYRPLRGRPKPAPS